MADVPVSPTDSFGAQSLKWEFTIADGEARQWDRTDPALGDDQVLPMWVADMDFLAAEPIRAALAERVDRGVFGYATKSTKYLSAVAHWMSRRHGWPVEHEWILPVPGVVPGLHVAVRQFTAPGDKVLIQRPVYHPFTYAVENNHRTVVDNALILEGGRYRMDFDDLESKTRDPDVKLAVLCTPHNPVGRVWSHDELTRFAEICTRNDVLVIADEIHADLTLPGHRFHTYGALAPALTARSIVCTAPSKAFNLAGLMTANFIIPDAGLRQRMLTEMRATGLYTMSPFGIVATQVAYTEGEVWLNEAVRLIQENMNRIDALLRSKLPRVRLVEPEASYLAWLDFRALEIDHVELARALLEDAKVYLSDGLSFGAQGAGFMRMNVACDPSILDEALARIYKLFSTR